MYELLRRAVQQFPSHPAVIRGESAVTYAELAAAAETAAHAITTRQLSRFALVEDDPARVVPILAAASLVGAEACLYPPTASLELVADLSEAFGHTNVYASRPQLGCDSVEELFDGTADESSSSALASSRPHLVLTTGTTGRPKAVRHDWSRLVSPVLDREPATGERWLLAYGMNQFGGLQVLLHTLAIGATLVATDAFSPGLGLLAMRDHSVTHVSATPTYWRFLLNELAAGEPPKLSQITLGGEATDQRLLDRLREKFPQARITQIYAANEIGAVRSINDDLAGLPVAVLDEPGSVQLKIVDGVLWALAPQAMLGYHGEPAAEAEWRSTGDLVEVVGDRVLFRGRDSDVINVGGVKVHPLPVEERVTAVVGVAAARVYGRTNPLTGSIVAVEVVLAPGHDRDAVDESIRTACADLPPAARPRSIRFVDALAVEGNKVARHSPNTSQEQT